METNPPEIKEFWFKGWETDRTPYHLSVINPVFNKHMEELLPADQSSLIFFPFCGKCVDMKLMYDKGHEVIGVEGVEKPIIHFFQESKMEFEVSDVQGGKLKLYQSRDGRMRLYNGNYYNMEFTVEKPFTAVWDRGALEAIPATERKLYVDRMLSMMAPGSCCLVEVAERTEESQKEGPPYFISLEELCDLYKDCTVTFLESFHDDKPPVPGVKHSNLYLVQKSKQLSYHLL